MSVHEEIRRFRILIVEDDADTLELIKMKFLYEGFEQVVGVAGGEEAIGELRGASSMGEPFSLVLLDLMLPDVPGIDVCRQIKERYNTCVIVVTAKTEKADQIMALSEGADDFITKPFDTDVLLLKVENHLTMLHLTTKLHEEHKRSQKLFLNVLQVMAKILEAKDPYVKFHSENVARYARQIAKRLNFSDEQIELIQIAGILHDFGKIGVKEGILNKSGHLTDKEFKAVKSHPLIASTILEPITELATIIDDIKHHHEYWNGLGYPNGLKGEEIPLGARVLMIADAFDAMTSQRSYHDPMTLEEAIEEMRRCSGSQFDPHLVDVFLEMLEDERHKDAKRPQPVGV